MDPDTQFWLTWWVRLAGTVGTVAAVLVALFGEYFRAKLFAPKLSLELVSAIGSKTPVDVTSPDGSVREESARFYHVRLMNERKWPRATLAQVYLVSVEEAGPAGAPQVCWSGDIPLKWQWHEIHGLQRTVGPDAICDLCSVVKGKWLALETLIQPKSLEGVRLHRVGKPVNMTVMLEARAAEGNSSVTAFRIAWDGQWEDGDAEMARHLIVAKLQPPIPFDPGAP